MTIQIIPIKPDHVESFHRTFDAVARERKYLSFLEAPPIEETRQFVLGCIERRDLQLVALVEGTVVGWCDIVRHTRPIHRHRGTLGMGIAAVHRGRGLGFRLIGEAISRALQSGIVRIELSVHADNPRAIALYEKVGFVREGVQRDAICIDGRYFDVLTMAIVER
jgi:RimJ/RimL family protein N-acetyltransferase